MKINNFINGEDVQTDSYFTVNDPGRNKEIVANVAKGSTKDVNYAISCADDALKEWSSVTPDERISKVIKIIDVLCKEKEDLSKLLVKEQGSLLAEANGEIDRAITVVKDSCELGADYFAPRYYEDDVSWVSIEKRPMGVIAAIVPWNAPILLTMTKLVPALITGNTIVIKPSPLAPVAISYLIRELGKLFPKGVVNIVNGEGDVGDVMTKHPLVSKISFTGGPETAKFVMENAAISFKGINLELGGNDPAIIMDDVEPVNIMEELVPAIFRTAGQVCFNIKRIYVHENIYEKFYKTMCEYVDEFNVGHGLNPESNMGPLNNENQYIFIKELIEQTKNSNASVVSLGSKVNEGEWQNGYYVPPHVVRDPDPKQNVVKCEQFGPIIPLVKYKNIEEAINMANDSEYGLCSSIWSQDKDRALMIAKQMETGVTFLNSHRQSDLGFKWMPFGGIKQSGLGWKRGIEGLDEYVESHSINYFK